MFYRITRKQPQATTIVLNVLLLLISLVAEAAAWLWLLAGALQAFIVIPCVLANCHVAGGTLAMATVER